MLKAALQHSLLQFHLPTPPHPEAGRAGEGGGSGLADEGRLGTGAVFRSAAFLFPTLSSILCVVMPSCPAAERAANKPQLGVPALRKAQSPARVDFNQGT